MAHQKDNLLYYDKASGLPQTINGQSIAISSDLEVGGNLTVLGTMSYIDSEILTSDAYLLMNSSYQGALTQDGGIVINTSMTQAGSLISVDAPNNTVVLQGVHLLGAGDIIALIDTNESQNDSLYEVASAVNNGVNTTIVLKAVVTNGYAELLRASTTLVNEGATVGAVGGKVTVAILRSDAAAGRFEYGVGSNAGLIVFSDIAASSLDLQTAYENGNAIVMTAANGGLDVSYGVNETVGISLDASGPSNFTVHGNDAMSIATAGGQLAIESNTGDLRIGTANTAEVKVISGASEGANDVFGRLLLDGNTVSLVGNGVGSSLVLGAHGNVAVNTNNGDITLASTGGTSLLTMLALNAVMLESVNSTLQVLSRGDQTLTAGTQGAGSNMTLTAAGGALTLRTTPDIATGTNTGAVTITSASSASLTADAGSLALESNNGDLTIQGLNAGTQSQVLISTDVDEIQVTSGNNLRLTSAADKTILMSAGTAALGTGAVTLTTNTLTTSTGVTTLASTGDTTVKTTAGGDMFLNSTGDVTVTAVSNATVTADGITLKGDSAATTQQIKLVNSDSDTVVAVERSTGFVGTRLNQSVSLGSALPDIAGISDVGLGVKVTVEAGVDVGEVLAINANARFDKALARRAQAGDPDLPQNPLGVACAPGQAAATTAGVFMSTVHGTSTLVQLTAAPAAGDVGKLVYLSPTNAGKGIVIPAGQQPQAVLSNQDGLTRVSTLGYLLSSTAITVPGLSGNVSVYPILWMVDILTDT